MNSKKLFLSIMFSISSLVNASLKDSLSDLTQSLLNLENKARNPILENAASKQLKIIIQKAQTTQDFLQSLNQATLSFFNNPEIFGQRPMSESDIKENNLFILDSIIALAEKENQFVENLNALELILKDFLNNKLQSNVNKENLKPLIEILNSIQTRIPQTFNAFLNLVNTHQLTLRKFRYKPYTFVKTYLVNGQTLFTGAILEPLNRLQVYQGPGSKIPLLFKIERYIKILNAEI